MKLMKSLRMLWLGLWLVVTGLLLMISTVIAALAKAEAKSSHDSDDSESIREQ